MLLLWSTITQDRKYFSPCQIALYKKYYCPPDLGYMARKEKTAVWKIKSRVGLFSHNYQRREMKFSGTALPKSTIQPVWGSDTIKGGTWEESCFCNLSNESEPWNAGRGGSIFIRCVSLSSSVQQSTYRSCVLLHDTFPLSYRSACDFLNAVCCYCLSSPAQCTNF